MGRVNLAVNTKHMQHERGTRHPHCLKRPSPNAPPRTITAMTKTRATSATTAIVHTARTLAIKLGHGRAWKEMGGAVCFPPCKLTTLTCSKPDLHWPCPARTATSACSAISAPSATCAFVFVENTNIKWLRRRELLLTTTVLNAIKCTQTQHGGFGSQKLKAHGGRAHDDCGPRESVEAPGAGARCISRLSNLRVSDARMLSCSAACHLLCSQEHLGLR
eukprot:843556-Pelagomonas_calceolata.AAC.2